MADWMRVDMPNPTHDALIRRALDDGALLCAPETGEVWTADRGVSPRHDAQGYLLVTIPGTEKRALVHRVVYIAAHGNIPRGLDINHRNSIRDDNRIENLEPVTAAENSAHARRSAYYERELPDDREAVDGDWLAAVESLAASGTATREQIIALLPEQHPTPDVPERYILTGRRGR